MDTSYAGRTDWSPHPFARKDSDGQFTMLVSTIMDSIGESVNLLWTKQIVGTESIPIHLEIYLLQDYPIVAMRIKEQLECRHS